MKCNVKGHLPDREVFGAVLPTFRGTNRKGKYNETDETRRKLERLQKKKPVGWEDRRGGDRDTRADLLSRGLLCVSQLRKTVMEYMESSQTHYTFPGRKSQ